MRVSWIASGAILIILAVILYMLRAAFSFLPGTIITYYWVIPTIFFLIGIIVLLFGLILPEHRRHAVYYHREPPRRTEQYTRERPPTYIKEQHVEYKEEPGTHHYVEQRPPETYRTETQPTTPTEQPRTTQTTTTTHPTTTTQPLPTYETVGQERQTPPERYTPTPSTTTTGHTTEVVEETHEKKVKRTT
jgi:hypothetical protein